MKNKAYRHGEIMLRKIDKIPEGLEKINQKEFLKGSHGHSHSFDNGEIYLKNVDDYIFGYFIAKNTTLLHTEHGEGEGLLKKAKIEDGIYELRRQVEYINGELKQVID